MEFKSLKNIESSFKQIRMFGNVFLCLCAVVAVFSVIKSYQFAEAQRQKFTFWMKENPSCWHSHKTFHRTVPSKLKSI